MSRLRSLWRLRPHSLAPARPHLPRFRSDSHAPFHSHPLNGLSALVLYHSVRWYLVLAPSHHSLCCICFCCVLCRTRYHAPSPIAPLRRPHPSLPIFQLIQTTLRHSRPYILPSSLPSTLSSPYPHPQPDCRVPIVAERLRPVDSLALRQLYTRSWHRQDPYRSLAPPIAHLRLSDGAVTPGDQRQYRITTFHQQQRPESSS